MDNLTYFFERKIPAPLSPHHALLLTLVVKCLSLAIYAQEKIFDVPKGNEFLGNIVDLWKGLGEGEGEGVGVGVGGRMYREGLLVFLAVVSNSGVLSKGQADFLKGRLELDYFKVVGLDLREGILGLWRGAEGGWRLGKESRVEWWGKGGGFGDAVLPVLPEKYFDLKFEFS